MKHETESLFLEECNWKKKSLSGREERGPDERGKKACV